MNEIGVRCRVSVVSKHKIKIRINESNATVIVTEQQGPKPANQALTPET